MTRALVVGSGVAGPVAAIALKRVGIDAVVFEREHANDHRAGSWLTFQANGMDALDAVGLAEPVRSLGFDVETISYVNGRGKAMGRTPLAVPRPDGQVSQMMRREDRYRTLGSLAAG